MYTGKTKHLQEINRILIQETLFDSTQSTDFKNFKSDFHNLTTQITYENKLFEVIFFEIKLLLQPDKVFDSESNGRNFSSLAPPGGEQKLFSILSYNANYHSHFHFD